MNYKSGLISKLVGLAVVLMGLVLMVPSSAFAADSENIERCYTGQARSDLKAMAGNTIGTTRVIGLWCSNSGDVTRATYLDGWAETSTLGWSVEKVEEKELDAGVHNGQGRIWQKFKLKLTIVAGWFPLPSQEKTVCPRIKGYPGGFASKDTRCSIY